MIRSAELFIWYLSYLIYELLLLALTGMTVLLLQGEFTKAIELFTKCIELFPDRVVPYTNRALCYLRVNEVLKLYMQ